MMLLETRSYRELSIIGYNVIMHRNLQRTIMHHPPPGDHTYAPIGSQNVHPQLDLAYRQEAMFHGEEWVFLISMHHLARLCRSFAMLTLCRRRNRQVHQVVVMVDPYVQDGLRLHLARLGIIGQDPLTYMYLANRLLPMLGGHYGLRRKATGRPLEIQMGCCILLH